MIQCMHVRVCMVWGTLQARTAEGEVEASIQAFSTLVSATEKPRERVDEGTQP
jgi:hypothetical protein